MIVFEDGAFGRYLGLGEVMRWAVFDGLRKLIRGRETRAKSFILYHHRLFYVRNNCTNFSMISEVQHTLQEERS